MGKKQHQKDKLYLTTTEWKELYGGHKDDSQNQYARAKFRRLPFTHCSISLQPFENPLCTTDGVVFDLEFVIPFIKKFGIDPVSGKKIDPKALIHLKYHKNAEGEFHCPVTFKVFTPNSHIVAIKTTGNVYAYEAVDELNLKPKHWKDLLSDEPFTRKDIITLQDPGDLNKFNISSFHHVKYRLRLEDEEEEKKAMEDPQYYLKKMNTETRHTLEQLKKDYKAPEKKIDTRVRADDITAANYSTGRTAAGFTSTTMDIVTEHEAAVTDEQTLKYRRVTKKGYIRMVTTLGPVNIELHCDLVPKTCENFITHCKNGYYNDTIFHRLIRNFMIQGGDPTGKGTGGESIWGKEFEDEFHVSLLHSGRGILSMANKGPNTNTSQFFIAFRQCHHLDRKHTVFGRVVGGLETLMAMEGAKVDKKSDKPEVDIKILSTEIFVNPYEEAEETLAKERNDLAAKTESELKEKKSLAKSLRMGGSSKDPDEWDKPKEYRQGIGKYIKPGVMAKKRTAIPTDTAEDESNSKSESTLKKKKSKLVGGGFGDFSSW